MQINHVNILELKYIQWITEINKEIEKMNILIK